MIDAQLSQVDSLPSYRKRTMVYNLPQKRYPLGTCVRLIIDSQYYLLVTVTRFNIYCRVKYLRNSDIYSGIICMERLKR